MGDMSIRVYHLLGLLLLFIGTRILLRILARVIKLQIKKRKLDEGRTLALFQIARYVIIMIAILVAMELVGIKLTILLGGAAALLVGIGLGLQSTFNDLISGIILLFEQSVSVGDIIEIQGVVGKVVKINIRTSELTTRDNISILVPNSKLVNDNITNWSHNRELTRFTISVGVQYGSDVQLVKKLLIAAADEHPLIDKTRATEVWFQDFGDSALLFDLKFWCDNTNQITIVKSDIRFAIDAKFRKNGVVIPYPQRDLHIKSDATK